MEPYRNFNGDSNIVLFETTEDSIHVVFRKGTQRNYLYNSIKPGKSTVDRMKKLAFQGYGLNSYITKTVQDNYFRKW